MQSLSLRFSDCYQYPLNTLVSLEIKEKLSIRGTDDQGIQSLKSESSSSSEATVLKF